MIMKTSKSQTTHWIVFLVLALFPLFFDSCTGGEKTQVYSGTIRIDQLGYYPDAPKFAAIADSGVSSFIIVDAASGKKVFTSELTGPLKHDYSPNETMIADFSAFQTPGKYRLAIPGKGESYEFMIGNGIFTGLTKGLIRGFYYQRMSIPLLPEYAEKWSRPEGHPDTEVIVHPAAALPGRPAGTVISCPRGWYDAGDYNKYVVNSGITMGTLLSFYEDYPSYCDTLALNIPESKDSVPDLLNEILWNLRWMFTMQDPQGGGVYNKVTTASFSGFVMPDSDVAKRYAMPVSTPATLDFAAVMAQAGRIFKRFSKELPGLSDSCIAAGKKAWQWAEKNPAVSYDQDRMNQEFKPEVTTGAYGDNDFSDEFIWAASELFITTRNIKYYEAVNMLPDDKMPLPSWGDVRLLGYYTLARYSDILSGKPKKDFDIIKGRIIDDADRMAEGIEDMPYRAVMGKSARDFVWGSNSIAANEGILLIQAYRITGDMKYADLALGNLDYMLGRNATGYSFVTGFGARTPMHPHHRPSEADNVEEPVPGLLVGGPNPRQQDGCKTYPSSLPDESYTDTVCSYASNEIAINWNAPAVYLAGALDAVLGEHH
jgi:endoglucanase